MSRILIALILLLSFPALASAFCFEQAGAEYGVSPRLLWSIAKVESGFAPQAVNWNQNGTYDYGLMQINSAWAKQLGPGIWWSLGDPCTNVKAGAWILAQCFRRYGYTWEAVGCYNASNERKRQEYARKVYAVFKRYFRRR
ncbi:MAG: lytic transglycosylase domain-containing protein [Nitrospiraceae bacterium]|nr:lytic transglycosylase domain-containing protein [Nitrospiraceae bacterium]